MELRQTTCPSLFPMPWTSLNNFLKAIKFADDVGGGTCDYDETGGYTDLSKSLFRNALEHNKNSSLETLVACHSVFAYHTTGALQKKKPGLKFGYVSKAWC
jgi:hypothetical protein